MTRKEIYERISEVALQYYDTREALAVAERLCCDVCGFSRFDVVMEGDKQCRSLSAERLEELLVRLSSGEPVQYIVGFTEFYGRRFRVQKGVLIPRPETEELVELVVKQNRLLAPRIIDLGTGSGAIAVSLACEIAGARVEALDLSDVALRVSSNNAAENGVDVCIRKGDIFEWKPSAASYDIIISNPPYIPARERKQMDATVTDYEPSEALFVPDESPLMFYEHIADVALEALAPEGRLYFEIHELLAEQTLGMLHSRGYQAVLHYDMNNKPRMIVCHKRS